MTWRDYLYGTLLCIGVIGAGFFALVADWLQRRKRKDDAHVICTVNMGTGRVVNIPGLDWQPSDFEPTGPPRG